MRPAGDCSDCPVRAFTLVLAQRGDALTGSLQASGRSGLGERETPLVAGKVAGRSVTFEMRGADGTAFEARLRVSGDGKTLEGNGRHRAGFGLTFTRSGP
jgi:hypothetical protein